MYHDDISYATTRLYKTVVRLKNGDPVYITNLDRDDKDKIVCSAYCVFTKKSINASLDDIDLTPVELGYVNYDNTSYYMMRKPIRKYWRQGLGEGNIFSNEGHVPIPCEELFNTIKNKYPSLKTSLEKVNDFNTNKIAFSRHFAINPSVLYYKNIVVGNNNNGSLNLIPKYSYLEEYLKQVI